MISNKHITKFITVLIALAVIVCLGFVVCYEDLFGSYVGSGISMDYETELFDTSEIIDVNIIMDQEDWDDMLANATAEEYYECNVKINGEMYYHVALRPKGNTSLTSIASNPDTDRFSLKLEFDHYVEGQTCHGLDKLILNNNYADATNMKEALIYDMYQFMGSDSSLYNYAKISVNGDYWGVYLALEAVEDSFLLRNYGTQNGELYKPESLDMDGAGGGMDFSSSDIDMSDMPNMKDFPSGDFDMSNMPDMGQNPDSSASQEGGDTSRPENFDVSSIMGGFSMGGSGSNLNYTDDDLDSYSTIWEGSVTDTGDGDHKRVVKALKNISEGNDLEKYMDVENIIKYMAVHVFSVNDDSLTGMMAHNYYLYESNGQLNMIPWDYNLSFGGMGSSNDASSVVNDAIDGAFSGTKFFDTLMDNEEYHQAYYDALETLVEDYINSGRFDEFYNRVRNQIDALVETDPTAFYSYEEYLTAVDTLYDVVKLRGESIEAQIDGTIASESNKRSSEDQLIDCTEIDLSVMGSMDTGGGMNPAGGGMNFGFENKDLEIEEAVSKEETEESTEQTPSMPEGFDINNMPENFNMEDMQNFNLGEMPNGFSQQDMPQGFGTENMPGGFSFEPNSNEQMQPPSEQVQPSSEETNSNEEEKAESAPSEEKSSKMPQGGSQSFGMPVQSSIMSASTIMNAVLTIVVMIGGLAFVLLYKRRRNK